MSNKKLNADAVLSELSGQSVYFKKEPSQEKINLPDEQKEGEEVGPKIPTPSSSQPSMVDTKVGVMESTNHETMTPTNHDTVVSRYHDTTIEIIRKAVKAAGKEAATYRFSVDEKRPLEDLVYAYNRRGLRTSANEIIRIAINFILQDHQENGENSILDLVLKALNE